MVNSYGGMRSRYVRQRGHPSLRPEMQSETQSEGGRAPQVANYKVGMSHDEGAAGRESPLITIKGTNTRGPRQSGRPDS